VTGPQTYRCEITEAGEVARTEFIPTPDKLPHGTAGDIYEPRDGCLPEDIRLE